MAVGKPRQVRPAVPRRYNASRPGRPSPGNSRSRHGHAIICIPRTNVACASLSIFNLQPRQLGHGVFTCTVNKPEEPRAGQLLQPPILATGSRTSVFRPSSLYCVSIIMPEPILAQRVNQRTGSCA